MDDYQFYHSLIDLLRFQACFQLLPTGRLRTGVGWADAGIPQTWEEDVPHLAEFEEQMCSSMSRGAWGRDRSCSTHGRVTLSTEAGLQHTRVFHSAHYKCTFQVHIACDIQECSGRHIEC